MKKIILLTLFYITCIISSAHAKYVETRCMSEDTTHDNILTSKEKESGWLLLFDGKTMTNWRTYKNMPGSWIVRDGTLCSEKPISNQNPDLITNDIYENFELSIDWKISPQGNSGIMYLVTEKYDQPYLSGPEYQLIDDDSFPAKIEDWQKTGANYAMQPPAVKATHAPGEWNKTKIIVHKGHVEHWLNGQKVVEYILWSEEWKREKATGKWKDAPGYGASKAGHIALQASHTMADNSGVCFRNIKIKLL